MRPRIIIVGAGFGGIAAAQALRTADAEIVLIDRTNHHLFQPLLYQVAGAALSPADIATANRALLRRNRNTRILMAEASGVDAAARELCLADGRRLPFDYLILATGAAYSFFGNDQWREHAYVLKSIDDALAIRAALLSAFERAEQCDDPAERQRLLTFAVVGGGPAGLYFALLMKRDWPDLDITVFERNQPDDTFGFGVVFSDQTLDIFKAADEASYAAIRDNFAYWDDIEVHFKDSVHRVSGNGFCGCSRRSLLLLIQARARQLGVELRFGEEAADIEALKTSYDLVVGSDGINSRIREGWRDRFQPEVDLRPNHFTWMGSTRPFDAFTFFFKETPHGVFIAHCYQYQAGRSTWVLETDPDTFRMAGLGAMDEAASAAFLEGVFAEELQGHRLITNRSLWRNFPMIRCRNWVVENVVLLGDAKATAHFSIGSGTKLAMEDAIGLHQAFHQAGLQVADALALFERSRREEVEKTQHAADVSLVWFEQLGRFWDFEPLRFAFGLMTRSKAITYDNLALRAPGFVAASTFFEPETTRSQPRMRSAMPADTRIAWISSGVFARRTCE